MQFGARDQSCGTHAAGSYMMTMPQLSSHLIQSFLAKHSILQVHQAPCDFWLFPRLKTPLKGSHFVSREDIQNAMAHLHTIPEQAFQKYFQRWKDHWGPRSDKFWTGLL
jgi:hypothetical protein